jgi:hypothetical protein
MPQAGLIFRALIASPGDCLQERLLIPDVISAWNSVHSLSSAAIVEPVLWETHARPSLAASPQRTINQQLLANCDLLIGTFWTRLGTATEDGESGTAEEIEQFRSAGKPTIIYFSSVAVTPDNLDPIQYKALNAYKLKLSLAGLAFKYGSILELRNHLQRHIASQMLALLDTERNTAQRLATTSTASEVKPTSKNEYVGSFKYFVREALTNWSVERDSEPEEPYAAKRVLSRAAFFATDFLARIENDRTGFSELVATCVTRLKRLERKDVNLLDTLESAAFWQEGDAVFSELRRAVLLLTPSTNSSTQ